MKRTKVRKVEAGEVKMLQLISRKTFYEAFSEENISKYLQEEFSLKKLTEQLATPSSEFYFATSEENIIGYVKLNFGDSQTAIKDASGVEIERIYVLKEYQGRKVGQLLFEKAMSVAAERHADYIWLGVWEKNFRAIGFYERNGFTVFDKHVFMLGDDAQTDLMMKRSRVITHGPD